jgi:hypothetical protein
VFTNDIPTGGKIVLTFGATFYDLESSSPCPVIELVDGVQWNNPLTNPNIVKTSCSNIFSSSVVTVSDIKPVTAGQV